MHDPQIQFYKEIKDYEQASNARSGYDYVSLHSYVISQTPLAKLGPRFNVDSEAQWNSWHVYFSNQEYATLILQDVLLSGD